MISVLAVERATLDAWRALHREELEGWILQADGGVTGRPNALVPLAFTGANADASLETAEAWYGARKIAMQVKITEGATFPADLAQRLGARGYVSHTPTLIMTRAAGMAPAAPPAISLHQETTPAFESVFADARVSEADHAERWGLILRAPQPRACAVARIDNRPAAVGLGIITHGLLGIYAMRTPAWARRQGLARQIVDALLAWSAENGAHGAYLQVEANNDPAIALYDRAGFTPRAGYSYWKKST